MKSARFACFASILCQFEAPFAVPNLWIVWSHCLMSGVFPVTLRNLSNLSRICWQLSLCTARSLLFPPCPKWLSKRRTSPYLELLLTLPLRFCDVYFTIPASGIFVGDDESYTSYRLTTFSKVLWSCLMLGLLSSFTEWMVWKILFWFLSSSDTIWELV